MKESENQSIPSNLYADLKDFRLKRRKCIEDILLDNDTKTYIDADPVKNQINLEVISKFGRLVLIVPEGDTEYES